MKKTIGIVVVILTILGFIFVPKIIQSYKEQFVTDFIQDNFKEDILFVAEVMPAFCIEEEVLIKYMFDEAYLAENYDVGMEKKNVLIIGFLNKFWDGLKAAQPQNPYHTRLQKNLLAHFEEHKIAELTLENLDAKLMELYGFFTSMQGVLEESKTEDYFAEKFADTHEGEMEKPEKSKDEKSDSKDWTNSLDAGILDAGILSIHSIAKQNGSYQLAYENGCMQNFMNGLKQMILDKKYKQFSK